MGLVAVTLRIMPDGPEINLNRIKKEVERIIGSHDNVELKNAAIKPIGFGLSALEILMVMPDAGGSDKIEEELAGIEGVESVEAGDITLL